VVPNVAPSPIGQWVEFDAALAVWLAGYNGRTRIRLLFAQARHPGAAAGEHARQRLQLAHRAAAFAQINALVHRLVAVAIDEVHHGGVLGPEDVNLDAIGRRNKRQQRERWCMQHTGIERGHGDRQRVACNQLGDQHVFRAQARGLHDVPGVLRGGVAQQAHRDGELGRVVGAGPCIEVNCAHACAPRANQGRV
jgi:hypothetical protein